MRQGSDPARYVHTTVHEFSVYFSTQPIHFSRARRYLCDDGERRMLFLCNSPEALSVTQKVAEQFGYDLSIYETFKPEGGELVLKKLPFHVGREGFPQLIARHRPAVIGNTGFNPAFA